MLTSTITTRCRQLAIDSRAEHLNEHQGKTPDAEGESRSEIQAYFTADWRILRREGRRRATRQRAGESGKRVSSSLSRQGKVKGELDGCGIRKMGRAWRSARPMRWAQPGEVSGRHQSWNYRREAQSGPGQPVAAKKKPGRKKQAAITAAT